MEARQAQAFVFSRFVPERTKRTKKRKRARLSTMLVYISKAHQKASLKTSATLISTPNPISLPIASRCTFGSSGVNRMPPSSGDCWRTPRGTATTSASQTSTSPSSHTARTPPSGRSCVFEKRTVFNQPWVVEHLPKKRWCSTIGCWLNGVVER